MTEIFDYGFAGVLAPAAGQAGGVRGLLGFRARRSSLRRVTNKRGHRLHALLALSPSFRRMA